MRFSTIIADPPWQVKKGTLRGREGFLDANGAARDQDYATMSVSKIARLPVRDLAERDAHLYLWTINRYVEDAFAVARAWGFAFSTMLVWKKAPMGGGLGGAFGISTEYVLFCRRGSLPTRDRIVGTCFEWKRPYDERGKPKAGAKPPEFLEVVERVSPPSYCELFSREKRPRIGWSYHGDESLQTVEMSG